MYTNINPKFDLELKKYKLIYGYEMNFNHSIAENKEYISKVTIKPKNFSLISNKRKSEFISGRICAQKSLERLNIYGEAIGICCDRSPRWPENVVGSITHNELRAVAIVASNQNYSNLGIDIECVVTKEVGDLICTTIIDDKEYLMMESVTISQLTKEAFITLIFSAKESIFKALYRDVGHFFGFEVAKLIKISKCILS